jgi:hypothetical protein
MKQVILAVALIGLTASAYANDNKYAGRCAALHLAMENTTLARIAMNHATNKGQMQVAAREWMDRLSRDKDGAVKSAVMACQFLGVK